MKFRQDLDQNGGGRIRTDDLEVMSLASYLAAPPRVRFAILPLVWLPRKAGGRIGLVLAFNGCRRAVALIDWRLPAFLDSFPTNSQPPARNDQL